MAGIKSITRSPDAFRLPAWDAAIAYPVNSMVAYWDSDRSRWEYFIAKRNTTYGSLATNDADSDWSRFSFDSDVLLEYARRTFDENFSMIYRDVDSDFRATLQSLDSDNDSDFAIVKADFDSDFRQMQEQLDSDLTLLRLDVDSELRVLRSADSDQSVLIEKSFRGRLYENVAYRDDGVSQRLFNVSQVFGNKFQLTADIYDGYANHYHTVTLETDSILDLIHGLDKSTIGNHVIAWNDNSELLTITPSAPAFIGEVSFQGANSGEYEDFFTSASAKFYYADSDYTVVNNNAAFTNEQRIVLENRYPTKPVYKIEVFAYGRYGRQPGINYIAVNTVFTGDELQTEKASVYSFPNAASLVRHPAHPDVLGFVANTNTMWVGNDSEWVVVDPNYDVVDQSLVYLEYNFNAATKPNGTRALVTSSGYEYYVHNNKWVLDSESMKGYDSDRYSSLDSDMNFLLGQYDRLDSDLAVAQSIYNKSFMVNTLHDQDSEIIVLRAKYNTLYQEFIALRLEHKYTAATIDSDVADYKIKYTQVLSDLADDLQAITDQNTAYQATIPAQVNAAFSTFTDDHDADIALLEQQILSAFDTIALLRQGEVADNDSDIRALERWKETVDSDIVAINYNTMKYRGFIDHTVDVPDNPQRGDVWQTAVGGYTLKPHYPGLDSEFLDVHTMIIYDDSDHFIIMGSSANGVTSNDIEVTAGFPAGTILSFSSLDSIPNSFRVCDGSYYNGFIYKELYSILGDDHLPDLRNQFLRGYNDGTDGFGNARDVLSQQSDEFKAHNHTYDHQIVGINRGYGGQADDDDIRRTTDNTSTVGGSETRPVNTMVVFAIAMYSGAGAQYSEDSDLWHHIDRNDSDIKMLYNQDSDLDVKVRKDLDSDIKQASDSDRHDTRAWDSDLQIQVLDNDSDILALQVEVAALSAVSNVAHVSALRTIDDKGVLLKNTGQAITDLAIGGAVPEPYVYPQLQFYYSTIGTNVHPNKGGRQLNGQRGTPEVSVFILHDNGGNATIGMQADSDILHDIQIVSTYRAQ